MKDSMFSVEEIKELMAAMNQNAMGKLKIKNGDYSLELGGEQRQPVFDAHGPSAVFQAVLPEPGSVPEIPGNVVTSPIVGTFYSAPSPESEPFVSVGSKVKKGDVLFIIESMKLMNEVTSQFDGEIAEIHVSNAEVVEYGQPVITIR